MISSTLVANLVLALCVSSISFTITRAGIFEGFRQWCEDNLVDKLDELIHCPYCVSHYAALIGLLITQTIFNITGWVIIDFCITWFAIVAVSAVFHAIMLWGYRPVADTEYERLRRKKS